MSYNKSVVSPVLTRQSLWSVALYNHYCQKDVLSADQTVNLLKSIHFAIYMLADIW